MVSTRWRSWAFWQWLMLGFLLSTVLAAIWFVGSRQSRDVEAAALQSGADVTVLDQADVLAFVPASQIRRTALMFICGSAVDAEAYAVLLRPVAEAGYPVFIVRLPYRRAFLHVHQPIVFDRVKRVIAAHPEVANWVLSGHSLGAILSVLFAHADPQALAGLALIASTYPVDTDLSGLQIPVTQIYATHDGMAAAGKVRATGRLLPPHTRWIEIEGGNHAQFGRYAEQALDGAATISREEQESVTRAGIMRLLAEADSRR